MLGFYGSQIRQTDARTRFGLDTLFAESIKGVEGREETPQFVNEFIRYCLMSEKLDTSRFPLPPEVVIDRTNNEKYVRILSAGGVNLVNQLVRDSGIDEFRQAITSYLTREKRPQLFAALADDLSPICIAGILAEAFYYLANGLEEVLTKCAQDVINNFFFSLVEHIRQQDYYRSLYRFLGNDCGLEQCLQQTQQKALAAIVNESQMECDRYVRERPEFYTEGTMSMWNLHYMLQMACRGYDYQNMIEAEPAIKQLLRLDFEQKVKDTIVRTFRQTLNQTLNTHLQAAAKAQAEHILQQYDQARNYLSRTLEKEAMQKIQANQNQQQTLQANIDQYNQLVGGINSCLEAMQLDRHQLPAITPADLTVAPVVVTLPDSDAVPVLTGEVVDALPESTPMLALEG